ncbi:uncharacterized protein SOCG_05315 [Schizosaccharomyces octosporus yFS286]|uniref:Uncharacterized protein n=1 Tax=Schizosaccharomyces octosporus (strain yFS286) TaxID=483514 RepID=S9RM83_SCHOY|nr:uncharacterized protein SOCG_05315 [Schizosaccharomyces octosporus yFS286]EPX75049.1 hypothetical protein SOCG_05315 [Schizosaccharomyces octosporus yFS286]
MRFDGESAKHSKLIGFSFFEVAHLFSQPRQAQALFKIHDCFLTPRNLCKDFISYKLVKIVRPQFTLESYFGSFVVF